jgi:hypothetical protein
VTTEDLRRSDRYVADALSYFDFLGDVDEAEWAGENADSVLAWPDGRTEELPTTYAGWRMLVARLPEDDGEGPVVLLKEARP